MAGVVCAASIAAVSFAGVATAAEGAAPAVASEGLTITPAAAGVSAPVQPWRALDTRSAGAGQRALGSNAVTQTYVRGHGVPSDAAAVWVNVTVTQATSSGHVVLWSQSGSEPKTSNLNFSKGETAANAALVPLSGSDGWMKIRNVSPGQTHVLIDVLGFVTKGPAASPGTTQPIAPARLADTRTSARSVPAGSYLDVQVAGRAGIPDTGVDAVSLNVTVTQASRSGYVVAYPSGTSRPTPASTVNFTAGQTEATHAHVKVGSNGSVRIFNASSGALHLVVDVFAYTRSGETPTVLAGLTAISPRRVLDTRTTSAPLQRAETRPVDAALAVPANASAAVVTLTATRPTTAGWLAAVPAGTGTVQTSTVNFGPQQSTSNLAVVPLTEGKFLLANSPWGTTDAVVDIVGWIEKSNTMSGRVTDPNGTGLTNVRVSVGSVFSAAVTDSDGAFDLVPTPRFGFPPSGDTDLPRTAACFGAPRPADPMDPGFAGECFDNTLDMTPIPMDPGTHISLGVVLQHAALIHGTVRDSDGNVVTGGTVRATSDPRSYGYAASIRPDGTFGIPNLWPGSYKVVVTNAKSDSVAVGGYASEWFDDVPETYTSSAQIKAAAVTFAVTGGQVMKGPDVVIDRKGRVTGTVTRSTGTVATSGSVRATHSTGVTVPSSVRADGTYQLDLMPGTWRICFGPKSTERCYRDATGLANATPVEVPRGQTVEGIDGVID